MDKFDRFFDIVQEEARKHNKKFFLFAGEGNDFETDDLEGENLSGWLVPLDKADEFMKFWADNDIPPEWQDCFVFVYWGKTHGKVSIRFEES